MSDGQHERSGGKVLKQGNLRGEKVAYPDGVGCCVWYPMPGTEEEAGLCFDFSESDIDDLIALLWRLKYAPAKPLESDNLPDAASNGNEAHA